MGLKRTHPTQRINQVHSIATTSSLRSAPWEGYRTSVRGLRKFLLIVAAALSVGPAHATDLSGTARIIDGDTLAVAGVTIRLFGIDAPERKQTCGDATEKWDCGTAATLALTVLIDGRAIACQSVNKDRYGRTVARCSVEATDLGAEMVLRGLALAYVAYSEDYIGQEVQARSAKVGVWRGDFVAPWEYRRTTARTK